MKRLLIVLIMVAHSSIMSQVLLTNGSSNLWKYVTEVDSIGDSITRDSIFLGLRWEPSQISTGRRIICTFLMVDTNGGQTLFIKTYVLPIQGPLILDGLHYFSDEEYPILFENGLKLRTTHEGILATLDGTNISAVLFSYEDFDFLRFKEFLDVWSRYLTGRRKWTKKKLK